MITIAAYAGAAVAEIAGCFAFWAWLRIGKSVWWIAPGIGETHDRQYPPKHRRRPRSEGSIPRDHSGRHHWALARRSRRHRSDGARDDERLALARFISIMPPSRAQRFADARVAKHASP